MSPDRAPSRRQFLTALGGSTALGLAGCLDSPGPNHASYSTLGDSVSDLDYDAALDRARSAGYAVESPFYVNARNRIGLPLDVPALADRFGEGARAVLVRFHYSGTRFLEADFTGVTAPRLVAVDEELGVEQPFRPVNLPPADWLRERIELLFPDADADALAAELGAEASRTEDPFVTVGVDADPDFAGTHTAFADRATATTASETQGDGWVDLAFAAEGTEFGSFAIVVPSARISTTDAGHEYEIKLDHAGGFRLQVTLPAGEELPEAEYRGVFREMFAAVGLPADRVAGYEFEYSPSVW
ncbi:hypothetical protein [Halolamina sp. C58]|uniref:hypothetical protein n=1 Tax=Halolamina sp. C58 TaxID=3421640 RepID=UPI003EBAAF20